LGLLDVAVIVAWLAFIFYFWVIFQLVAQIGRLLLRIEALERHLGDLVGLSGASSASPPGAQPVRRDRKAVARGLSRRRALRGLLGGIAGAVAASLWARGKAPSVEAGPVEVPSLALQQPPGWNQAQPRINQRPPGLTRRFNQQLPPGLNQHITWNQRFNQDHPRFNQRRFNQTRRGINQTL